MSISDIARIRESIEAELVSMRLGLNGLATGMSKHAFIEAKMHRVGGYEEQLAEHIGREQATTFSCQAYIQVMEEQ